MSWEQVKCRLWSEKRPDWWADLNSPGISVSKGRVQLNQALVNLLQLNYGSLVMVFVDRKNNAIGIRNPQPGEESGAYTVLNRKGDRDKGYYITPNKKLTDAFPWFQAGTCWRAELADSMVVIRNKLI